MDAWNRQKTSAKEISATAADDVLALKGNHGTLPDEVQSFLDDAHQRGFRDVPHQFVATVDQDHGRLETRRYWITAAMDWVADKPAWEQ